MKQLIALFGFFLSLVLSPHSRAEELVTDLSDHIIAIRSNFTGTELLVFGAIETNSQASRALARDVVLVVRGPSKDLTIRKKEKKGAIWMNTQSASFEKVPGFYAVASTKPLALIASQKVLQRYQIGTAQIRLKVKENKIDQTLAEEARLALVRLNTEKKLYSESSGGVSFLGDTLFRANLEIPATVPVGVYTADVFLFRDGNVVHAQSSPLYVNKSGLERLIYSFAQTHGFFYGLIAVILALMAGWVAAILFKKN